MPTLHAFEVVDVKSPSIARRAVLSAGTILLGVAGAAAMRQLVPGQVGIVPMVLAFALVAGVSTLWSP